MVGLVEIYLILGGFFGALHLWAKRQLEEKIETKDVAVAILTIFVWLPVLVYYAVGWFRLWRQLKQQKQLMEEIFERALKKLEEEEGDENGSN